MATQRPATTLTQPTAASPVQYYLAQPGGTAGHLVWAVVKATPSYVHAYGLYGHGQFTVHRMHVNSVLLRGLVQVSAEQGSALLTAQNTTVAAYASALRQVRAGLQALTTKTQHMQPGSRHTTADQLAKMQAAHAAVQAAQDALAGM